MKISYLILGGVGFTGRNIVELLLQNDENIENIIVVDKCRPELGWLTGRHKECFNNPKIIYKQKNLANPSVISEILETYTIDYVINCATESRYGMSSEVYEEVIVNTGVVCATAVSKCPNVKRFIQLSSGQVYSHKKAVKNENGKIDPWTKSARALYSLENKLKTIPNLNYVIIRTAFAYGIGDRNIIMSRIIIAAVYKLMKETMKMLWNKDLIMNTVHIYDVANASIFLCTNGDSGSIYNVVDKSHTTQGSLANLLSEIFDVKYSFVGKAESKLAKIDIKSVCQDINEKHMEPWSSICQKESILSTPLSPFIDKEVLDYRHLSMDGTHIESLGFTYKYPIITKEPIKDIINDLVENHLFPKACVS